MAEFQPEFAQTDEDVPRKSGYVEKVMKRLQPEVVWDLGANTGEFSLIAAAQGAFVVSIDGDPACTEGLYQKVSGEDAVKGIVPLTMDLANPSPGLGWNGKERFSLSERGPATLIMALALVHHLVLSSCVPLEMRAQWLSTLGKHLLVEFVPPQDPMVKKLLHNRGEDHLPLIWACLKKALGSFSICRTPLSLKMGVSYFCIREIKKPDENRTGF